MEVIITAVSITGLMWVLINFIELGLDYLGRRDINHHALLGHPLTKMEKVIRFIEVKLCLKCFSFWFALIYTQDFLLAGLTGLIAYLIDAHVLKKKIKL